MKFQIVDFKDAPDRLNLTLTLMHTRLRMHALIEKYQLIFTKWDDDLGEVHNCLIRDSLGNFFMIMCREVHPEFEPTVWCIDSAEEFEHYVEEKFRQFIHCTDFDVDDIDNIWKFIDVSNMRKKND